MATKTKPGFKFATLADLREAVARERHIALREARGWKWIFSRGTFLSTANEGGQCAPSPEAEALAWDGTLREINELIERVTAEYPEATKIYISGGYDGADTMQERTDGEYEPWIAEWNVTVWERAPQEPAQPSAPAELSHEVVFGAAPVVFGLHGNGDDTPAPAPRTAPVSLDALEALHREVCAASTLLRDMRLADATSAARELDAALAAVMLQAAEAQA